MVPVLRVANAAAALAWYGGWGFTNEWEHRLEPGMLAFVSIARRRAAVPVREAQPGTGMTRVLFFSAVTSTTVCSGRSCKAAGSAAMTKAACASLLDAWYSPSAVMIRARRSRSASAYAVKRAACSDPAVAPPGL